ncbi:MAG TPA: hypothetical protein VFQ61_09095, partial [Polyangiaceae bacterium]|nr:hypothetical protein [Polyangiaceae bacterium]
MSTTPPISGKIELSGRKEHAMHALERAVAASERGFSDRPVTLISAEDLACLSRPDVRRALDRVMLGQHADLGLDALLVSGVLEVLLPEVKAMVGFGDG